MFSLGVQSAPSSQKSVLVALPIGDRSREHGGRRHIPETGRRRLGEKRSAARPIQDDPDNGFGVLAFCKSGRLSIVPLFCRRRRS